MASLLNMSGRALVKMPYDAEIEYLESTGTQYIDTQINISGSLGVETSMYLFSIYNSPFGGRIGYMDGSFMLKKSQGDGFEFAYGKKTFLTGNFVEGKHSFSYVDNIVKYDNTTINCSRDTFVTIFTLYYLA